jgi:peptide-methionine (S)-S-oxide reductase
LALVQDTPGKIDDRLISGKREHYMTEIATFGAGCFWGIEAAFRRIPGVVDAAVGYSGGHTQNPTYQDVCTDETGHAEVVQVTFDPAKVTYEQLLDAFWKMHNPTQKNRQGPDFGSQYRTAIFFHSAEQEATAKKSKAALDASKKFAQPVATEITTAGPFYRAEEYHQKYLEKRGAASCHF